MEPRPPHKRPWGIYSGYFRDPDGHSGRSSGTPAAPPPNNETAPRPRGSEPAMTSRGRGSRTRPQPSLSEESGLARKTRVTGNGAFMEQSGRKQRQPLAQAGATRRA
jgi:hypothetical protein